MKLLWKLLFCTLLGIVGFNVTHVDAHYLDEEPNYRLVLAETIERTYIDVSSVHPFVDEYGNKAFTVITVQKFYGNVEEKTHAFSVASDGTVYYKYMNRGDWQSFMFILNSTRVMDNDLAQVFFNGYQLAYGKEYRR